MRFSVCAAVLAALSVSSSLHAAEPMTGRWAVDRASCAQAALVVSNEALRWSGLNCRIGRSYRTGNTLHMEAFCSDQPSRSSIAVSLRLAGERIFVTWNRRPRGELRRCPREKPSRGAPQ